MAQEAIEDLVATTGSPSTAPHSPTLRLLVSRIAPFSLTRRLTSWKNRCAAFAIAVHHAKDDALITYRHLY